jgi:hypothetical protein
MRSVDYFSQTPLFLFLADSTFQKDFCRNALVARARDLEFLGWRTKPAVWVTRHPHV